MPVCLYQPTSWGEIPIYLLSAVSPVRLRTSGPLFAGLDISAAQQIYPVPPWTHGMTALSSPFGVRCDHATCPEKEVWVQRYLPFPGRIFKSDCMTFSFSLPPSQWLAMISQGGDEGEKTCSQPKMEILLAKVPICLQWAGPQLTMPPTPYWSCWTYNGIKNKLGKVKDILRLFVISAQTSTSTLTYICSNIQWNSIQIAKYSH